MDAASRRPRTTARSQLILLATELVVLVLFSVWALVRVYADQVHGSVHPSLSRAHSRGRS